MDVKKLNSVLIEAEDFAKALMTRKAVIDAGRFMDDFVEVVYVLLAKLRKDVLKMFRGTIQKAERLSSEFFDAGEYEDDIDEDGLEETYANTMRESANRTLEYLLVALLLMDDDKSVKHYARKYAEDIVGILERGAKRNIRSIISQARVEGWDTARVEKELFQKVALSPNQIAALDAIRNKLVSDGLNDKEIERRIAIEAEKKLRYRARMIARTESTRAKAEGEMIALKREGIRMVMYRTMPGACQHCIDNEAGNPYTIDQIRGMIPAHVNCMCYIESLTD